MESEYLFLIFNFWIKLFINLERIKLKLKAEI